VPVIWAVTMCVALSYNGRECLYAMESCDCIVNYRVRTDLEKSRKWKCARSWKAFKMIVGMEKPGRILENCDADLENEDVYYT